MAQKLLEKYKSIVLELFENEYSIYKFDSKYKINENIFVNNFFSITKTDDEVSIVTQEQRLNEYIEKENGWKILKIEGILEFNLIGILNKLSNLFANENISIFVISTYNTDYILVKKENIEKAVNVLIKNDYEIKGLNNIK